MCMMVKSSKHARKFVELVMTSTRHERATNDVDEHWPAGYMYAKAVKYVDTAVRWYRLCDGCDKNEIGRL